ncbi:MAG: hypothetical protein IID15_03530 [Candidatus Marinimicrobia bacterium]|nr:hypothetical protein [Candidatus Neomarinimicrobiota bacterium]
MSVKWLLASVLKVSRVVGPLGGDTEKFAPAGILAGANRVPVQVASEVSITLLV